MDKSVKKSVAIRHALGASLRPVTEHLVYRVRSGIAAGTKRRGGFGFLPRSVSDEEKFYQLLDLRGKTVYDVGSYEGIFSLFAARAVGQTGTLVVCEPNPESYRRTTSNLSLNDFKCQVFLHNVALGNANSTTEMVCVQGEPALSTMVPAIASSLGGAVKRIRIEVKTLDWLIASGSPVPQFMKIDTEGAELAVLQGACATLAAYGPELFIEMHGTSRANWIDNRNAVQALVESYGYLVYDMHDKLLKVDDSAGHLHCVR